jgi:RNA polymerase sigma-70 factor (ECF subfamily)
VSAPPGWLAAAVRAAGGRIVAALAARYRDLDLAEDAFADACLRAASQPLAPDRPDAWLWRVADRAALDRLRARRRSAALPADPGDAAPNVETLFVPDERLRLFLVAGHPALAPESRAALILRLVAGLSVEEIAHAFLTEHAAMLQRLTRAKRKVALSGIPFDLPGPAALPQRLEAVLSALDVMHARAQADAAGAPETRALAGTVLELTALLAGLMPDAPDAAALAASVRYAEARRPARIVDGRMIPLAEQDPARWSRQLIVAADGWLARAGSAETPRVLQARLQALWCRRADRTDPAPWAAAVALYDRLLALRDNPIVRLNRAVALAETAGPATALDSLAGIDPSRMAGFQPWHAVRASLLARLGRTAEARSAYDAALALTDAPAERAFIARARDDNEKGRP